MRREGLTICHECMLMLRLPHRPRQSLLPPSSSVRQWTGRTFTTKTHLRPLPQEHDPRKGQARSSASRPFTSTSTNYVNVGAQDLSSTHNRIVKLTTPVLQTDAPDVLPTEKDILYILEQLDTVARALIDAKSLGSAPPSRAIEKDNTATSALLGSVNAKHPASKWDKASLLKLISSKAEAVVRHPTVFLTPDILTAYVNLQSNLHRPSSFPDVFLLYATKPTPSISGSGRRKTVRYKSLPTDRVNLAIPLDTATKALDTALASRDLPLSLDIIDTTLATRSFRKSKILRKAFLPFSGLLLAPLAAYSLSSHFALNFQTSMDPSYATGVAFAGIMTYITTVSGLGYVVITTANDQMDRVTWAKGVPLWERWVREEERAALDRIAGEWGFKDKARRGDEEGREWDLLREEIGRRGMYLDRVELMEGMQ